MQQVEKDMLQWNKDKDDITLLIESNASEQNL